MKMKIFVFAILIICTSCPSFSQSFLGVKYGTPYEDALSLYQEKYHDGCQNSGQHIIIVTPAVGGCVFDCALAYFSINENGMSVLDGGVMFREKYISEINEQLELENNLIKNLKNKYGSDILESTDADGFPMLSFGKKIRGDGKWLGSVSIVLRKDENNLDVCTIVLNYSKIIDKGLSDL